MMYSSRRYRWAALLVIAQVALCADNPAPAIHNFVKVNDEIYRGAEPSPIGIADLKKMGIKTVLDLREPGVGTKAEKLEVEALHMKYINIPMRPFSAPTPAEVERALSVLLDRADEPVFLHCRRGRDRTGTVVACYRVQHDGWTNRRALDEAKSHGMSMTERGMRSYILRFTPFSDLDGLTAAKQ